MNSSSPFQKILAEGLAHHQAGRTEAAFAAFARARSLDPRSWAAHHYGGMSALLLNRSDEACRLFAQAFQLNPKSVETAVALGLSLLTAGQIDVAERTLRFALRLSPNNGDLLSTLAMILQGKGAIAESLELHERASVALPRNPMIWLSYGTTLMNEARIIEAAEKFEKALKWDPSMLEARTGRAGCMFRMHRVDEAVKEYRRILDKHPDHLQSRSHMLMALNSSATLSAADLFREHVLFGRYASATGGARRPEKRALAEGSPLRVAILSPDLRGHAVASFMLPLTRHAKALGIELHLFHDSGSEDAASEEFKRHATSWTRVAGQLDAMVEQRILSVRPDVLLELTGHTSSNRLGMLARRLAPLQATYLGYPNTTGVPAIDIRLVDPISDPAGQADALCTERLVRFSSCAWCYSLLVDTPAPKEVLPPPVNPVFGCFNNFTKVNDETLRVWGELLEANAGARLLVKSPYLDHPAVAEPIRRRMADAGLDSTRVELLGHTPGTTAHLELYKRIDVALDTYPYNGTTTTCEALWMGVPVVTLRGDRHAARVGTSLLTAVGHADWVASSWDEYRRIATRLAREPGTGERGETLRQAMIASPLMDSAGQAKRFWEAIRTHFLAAQ